MKKLMTTLIVLIALVIVAGVGLRLAMPTLSGETVATGIETTGNQSVLGDCPDTPNCQGSESTRAAQQTDRFEITKPANDAINSLATIISDLPGAQILEQDKRYLHVVFTTKIMGYQDDTEFLVSDDGQNVQVRSASRVGKSDLGANAERVEMLRALSVGKL